jgi:hypothetical protein
VAAGWAFRLVDPPDGGEGAGGPLRGDGGA